MRRTGPVPLGCWLLGAFLLLGASREAWAGDIDDTVYLQNGGRVRGIVVEQSPTAGVRLRLPDGTVRYYAAADVHHVTYGSAVLDVRSDAPRSGTIIRFGVGAEPVLWYVPASRTTQVGGRAFGCMQIELTPLAALRLGLGVGALDGVSSDFAVDQGATSIPVSIRADVLFNVARHYAVGLGVDLGVDIYREHSAVAVFTNPGSDNDVEAAPSASATNATVMLGLHLSPATLRFGRANQFQLSVQDGFLFFTESGRNPAFEQTIGFAYLFGSSDRD